MTKLYKAEGIAAGLIAFTTGAAIALAAWRGVEIDYASFAGHYLLALVMVTVAAAYRLCGRSAEIAAALLGCAIFILFSNAGAVLNFLLLRPGAVPIDGLLFRADAAIGFDWAATATVLAGHPNVSRLLGYVYLSSLAQLVTVILFLGLTGRQAALHRFVLTGIICSAASMAIWTMAPSFGPSAYVRLDPLVEAQLGRVVNDGYGARLLSLLDAAPRTIGSADLIGLIAFPSMHTVMSAMALVFTRRTALFLPLGLLNLGMIPAIVVHGGHHLTDLAGGLTLFAIVLWWVRRLVPAEDRSVPAREDRVIGASASGPLLAATRFGI